MTGMTQIDLKHLNHKVCITVLHLKWQDLINIVNSFWFKSNHFYKLNKTIYDNNLVSVMNFYLAFVHI